jgi:hypothetical protein
VLFVKSTISVHRIPSRVRDDREPPLWWDETARVIVLIWVKRRKEYFCKWDWTGQIRLIRLDNSPSAQTPVPKPAAARTYDAKANKMTERTGGAEYFNLLCWKPASTCWRLLGSGLGAKASKEEQHGCKPKPGRTAHST